MLKRRYQVFISSTYEDLREERQKATQSILEADCFPSGMEMFPASDQSQWELIRQVISDCDYYVVIVGGRYGSIAESGISYTEMEYDYAIECEVPVMGFIKEGIDELPAKHVSYSTLEREKLARFREKVMSRSCRKFSTADELGMAVMKSLMHEIRVNPRVGWVRSDEARSQQDIQRERDLMDRVAELEQDKEDLQRLIRDLPIFADEVPYGSLSQGEEKFRFDVKFRDDQKEIIFEAVDLTWTEIFASIGPSMFGYIVRRAPSGYEQGRYPFQDNLEQVVRLKIFERAKDRKINMIQSQIDKAIIQFKELGYIMFSESYDGDKKFRGITLTEKGERKLTAISMVIKD